MSGVDFAAEGLLDGLEGPERAARERLLASLAEDGVSLEELKAAVTEDRLALLPVERVLVGRYTAADVERLSGLPASLLSRIMRSLGLPESLPDQPIFCEEDVEAARSIRTFIEAGFGEAAIAEITRVLGEGMARVSAAAAGAFAETFLKPGDTEDEVAWRFASLAENLTPAFEPVLGAAFRAHVLDNVRRAMISRAELQAGEVAAEQEVAVSFADLVGFTRLGAELETQELGDVVGRFGELAACAARPPVRLVKTIGDAALLVSRECGPLVQAALSLLEEVEAADLPAVRCGIAWGAAVPRAGDLYGHAVNLSSRITGLARPGSVLCTEEVRDAAEREADDGGERFDWSFAGRHRLKGVADSVPLHRARRMPPGLQEDEVDPTPLQAGEPEPPRVAAARAATKRRAGRRRR